MLDYGITIDKEYLRSSNYKRMSTMSRIIEHDLSNRRNICYYAVCESCFLIATILESREEYNIGYCPRCLEKLSLIPLSPDEIFTMSD
jgi:hypothetical protein